VKKFLLDYCCFDQSIYIFHASVPPWQKIIAASHIGGKAKRKESACWDTDYGV